MNAVPAEACHSIGKERSLDDLRLLNQRQWLVTYSYIPSCPSCRDFNTTWCDTITILTKEKCPFFRFCKVNMIEDTKELQKYLEKELNVDSYPTLIAFPPGSNLVYAAAHVIQLYQRNNPSLYDTLKELLKTHPRVTCKSTESSKSSPQWLALWDELCGSSVQKWLPNVMDDDVIVQPLPCKLPYCVAH